MQSEINEDNKLTILGTQFYYAERYKYHGGYAEFSSLEERTYFYVKDGFEPEIKWSWLYFRKKPTGKYIPKYKIAFYLRFWISKDVSKNKLILKPLLELKASVYFDSIKK